MPMSMIGTSIVLVMWLLPAVYIALLQNVANKAAWVFAAALLGPLGLLAFLSFGRLRSHRNQNP